MRIPNVFLSYLRQVAVDGTLSSCSGVKSRKPVIAYGFDDSQDSLVDENDEKILEPFGYYRHLLKGKSARTVLMHCFNAFLGLPEDWVIGVTKAIEDLHNASLLIDDIEDESALRRGSPAAHMKYGIALTMNAGNLVYFTVLQDVYDLGMKTGGTQVANAMARIYTEEMIELHRGQGIEIWWRDQRSPPSVDQYIHMLEQKTGGLLRLGVRLLQCHPGVNNRADLSDIALRIGVYYQLRDDYINLMSTSYHDERGFAEDMTEGKYTFPMLHSLKRSPDSGLREILDLKPADIALKKKAIAIMQDTGSLVATRNLLGAVKNDLSGLVAEQRGDDYAMSAGLERFLEKLYIAE
uniref:Geranylgeranyl pyrophosphate synthase n=1 Tax=Clitopilus passeckerianus TaxID=648682 RepID=PLE4_CLIPA|nr:RecName: Full=Geranylgeranyl pyrophosphate synthase; Short=GGPP synthase; Short=GGPPSase; Short=GGS; AltName: Full=(2E,6E)-farnesyl diphosphate synthase; AltName: Full=Dimethylallyltranstransferase; AltName: Full=Farnesyl diphosphate synthase; AltName: Full=Farnesyltranstransferase; AltName: Full=Geranylgeranyl diphosphate synthase; AltName: Full=Geranyltranstransferase; AltName: Full=Pleuromutilin biosynthetic cluster protein synthesis protein G [Clitopilus passeckerianus]AVA16671.1 geranylger